jgi:translin
MHNLEEVAERIRQSFDARTHARDQALAQSRTIIKFCAHAIRATHRNERDLALENLRLAQNLVKELKNNLSGYPDLYHAGYTQNALKEYAEANIVFALIDNGDLPDPEELDLSYSSYLQGLAEAAGELRRRCLDSLRKDNSKDAELILSQMDDIYAVLITMDYPDAITGGLRRLTDIVRGVTERTRGDLTLSLRQEQLEKSLEQLEDKLSRD